MESYVRRDGSIANITVDDGSIDNQTEDLMFRIEECCERSPINDLFTDENPKVTLPLIAKVAKLHGEDRLIALTRIDELAFKDGKLHPKIIKSMLRMLKHQCDEMDFYLACAEVMEG